jgi:cell division protein YceG involved in septum cleavage
MKNRIGDLMKKKWNWIDTTIILIIILLVVAVLNKDKIFRKKSVVSNQKDIEFIIEADGITQDMLTELEIGDQIFSQNALQEAFVEEINIEQLDKPVYKSEPKIKSYEDAEEIKASIKISGKVAFSGPYMDLGGQEIKVGLPFIMKTTKVEFPSTIKWIGVK